mgnify:CR=1 FL=1
MSSRRLATYNTSLISTCKRHANPAGRLCRALRSDRGAGAAAGGQAGHSRLLLPSQVPTRTADCPPNHRVVTDLDSV